MKKITIAIDGPSASGKSTVAKILAKDLGYIHIDTGAMYRCVAFKCLENSIDLLDEDKICKMLKETKIVQDTDGNIYLDDVNVTTLIRTNEISLAASKVSTLKKVREDLVLRQQELGKKGGIIMDGRDIGTVVLPMAQVKIFMVASSKARALRRHKENLEKNIPSDLNTLEKEIAFRDHQDSTRANSPLVQASDAFKIDTSNLNIDEVVSVIKKIVYEKIGEV